MQDEKSRLLSQKLLMSLADRGDIRRFPRGKQVITEGEVAGALYILVSGELKVYTRDDSGRELIYNIMRPGEFFGEMFLDGEPRSASVKAISDALCVVVGEDKLRSFMQQYPEFAECLVIKLIERLRHATQQIRSLALEGVYERTILLLNELSEEEDGQRVIPPTLTQQEIADRVGASREMINRILGDLVRGGFLEKAHERRLVITRELPRHW